MNKIGIMQGRLLPPIDNRIQAFPHSRWEQEFSRAKQAGLDCIEWIYEGYGNETNPIGSDGGIARMKSLELEHGIAVRSLCADYFMEKPLVRATPEEIVERLEKLSWLLSQCAKAGVVRVVIPFVDASAIQTTHEQAEVAQTLQKALRLAEFCKVELHLETSLAPRSFGDLLGQLPHPLLKVNYDSGNSASLGYNPEEEFMAYGERIGSVHIKDRKLNGGTVPLGAGDVDFKAVFDALRALRYDGDFILQVARGETGDEVNWAKQNKTFFDRHWQKLS